MTSQAEIETFVDAMVKQYGVTRLAIKVVAEKFFEQRDLRIKIEAELKEEMGIQ